MFNIDLGIKEGNESLIQEQLNDPICGVIGDVYDSVVKLGRLYYDKRSINKKEYAEGFSDVTKMFAKASKDRFGIEIKIRSSNTFAIIPIFNPDKFDTSSFHLKRNRDLTHGIKQIKEFNKWIESNELILDKKEAKFLNLPHSYYVPLFISTRYSMDLKKEEFIAVILHEIGHVFTLLEMYSKTSATTSILITNLLRNKSAVETAKDLKISKKPTNDENALTLIVEHIKKDLARIGLGGKGTGETDPEIEADNFTVKFGYGADLSSALVKLNGVDMLTFTNAGMLITLTSIIGMAFRALLLSLILPGGLVLMAALALEIGLTINSISRLLLRNSSRNPIGDEHGSLKERIETIKTSMVEVLRKTNPDKNDTKLLLAQYDRIVNDLNNIEKSAHGKILIGLLSEYLIGNLNTEDELALKLNELENSKLYVQEARFSVGLESIKYQGKKDPVINELITFFAKLKDNSIVRNTATFMRLKVELEDITYKRFGISLFVLPAYGITGGWACIPFNVVRQKGISDWKTYYSKSALGIRSYIISIYNNRNIMEDFKNGNNFTLDLENAKIHGMDRNKHKNVLFIEFGRDMFGTTITGLDLTPEEMTAVYLHEIGHLFTYFESLKRTIVSNTLLLDSLRTFDGKGYDNVELKYRKEYDEDAEELLTIKGSVLGAMKQVIANGIQVLISMISVMDNSYGQYILTEKATKDIRLGNVKSWMTDSEVVADDFSTRMGMGKELVSGLDRLLTFNIHNKGLILLPLIMQFAVIISGMLIMSGDAKALGRLPYILLLNLKFIFLAYSLSMVYRVLAGRYFPYEKLPERFDSVSRSLIRVVRENDVDKKTKKEILNTIEEVKKIQKEVTDMGYGSLLLSMFIPNPNIGKEISLDGTIVDNLDKLINNDLFFNELRFSDITNGDEAMRDHDVVKEVENTVYYKEFGLWSTRLNELLGKGDINVLNSVLEQYGVKIENLNKKYLIKTPVPVKIADGYTGFSIFELDSEKDPRDKTVVTVTIDADKVIWLLKNPYIEVYKIDTVILDKDRKVIYVIEMEYLTNVNDDKKAVAIHNVYNKLGDVIKDYGELPIDEMVDKLTEYLKNDKKVKIPKEIYEQLALVNTILNEEKLTGKLRLDLHDGNFGLNPDGEIVIFDPIVNDINLGLKVSNYIDIKKYDKYLTNVKPGIENLDLDLN